MNRYFIVSRSVATVPGMAFTMSSTDLSSPTLYTLRRSKRSAYLSGG